MKWRGTFSRSGVRYSKVNSETDPKDVTRTICFLLGEKENGGDNGIVLIITHAAIYALFGRLSRQIEHGRFLR